MVGHSPKNQTAESTQQKVIQHLPSAQKNFKMRAAESSKENL